MPALSGSSRFPIWGVGSVWTGHWLQAVSPWKATVATLWDDVILLIALAAAAMQLQAYMMVFEC